VPTFLFTKTFTFTETFTSTKNIPGGHSASSMYVFVCNLPFVAPQTAQNGIKIAFSLLKGVLGRRNMTFFEAAQAISAMV
jgi:hypothetical protein